MNRKLDYIATLFQKTSHKRIENYCLTRFWHQLNNDEVRIVPQQYVQRGNQDYALVDIYLPQVNMFIEINEKFHYDSIEKIEKDNKRENEITNKIGQRLFVIDASKDLEEINLQIDKLVAVTKSAIEERKQKGQFKPWEPDAEMRPSYWKEKKVITVGDEVSLQNIEDICKLFDADFSKTKRGYLRKGGIQHPQNEKIRIWWPSETKRQGWKNTYDKISNCITESHTDKSKNSAHFKKYKDLNEARYVFFHHTDELGFKSYKFIGVFRLDLTKSGPKVGNVWHKIGDEIRLGTE